MQQQQPQQQQSLSIHTSYGRQPQQSAYNRNPTSSVAARNSINNVNVVNASTNSNAVINSRQSSQHQQTAQPTGTPQQILFHPQIMLPYPYNANHRLPNYTPTQNIASYGFNPQFYTINTHNIMLAQQHRSNNSVGTHIQNPAQLSGNVNAGNIAAAASQQQSHQQTPHQTQINPNSQLITQTAVSHPTVVAPGPPIYMQPGMSRPPKRLPTNRLAIIDPHTGENVLHSLTGSSSANASNASSHSSALPIVAPPRQNTPSNKTSSDSTYDPNASGQNLSTPDKPDQHVDSVTSSEQIQNANSNAQPHTPIVSAIADGPSINITPKQSKNLRKGNKPFEMYPMQATNEPSSEAVIPENLSGQPQPDASLRSNIDYAKVISTPSSTKVTNSGGWVKNNQGNLRPDTDFPDTLTQSQQQKAAHLHNSKSKITHTTVLTTSISTPTTVTINTTNQNMKTKDRTILSSPGGLSSTNADPQATQNKQHPMHKVPQHNIKNEFVHDYGNAPLKQAAMLQPQLVSNPKGFQDGLMQKGDRTKYSMHGDNKNLLLSDGNNPMAGAQKFKQYSQQYHVPQVDKKGRPHAQGDYEALKPNPKASIFDNKKIFDGINHMSSPPKHIPTLSEDSKRIPGKKSDDLDKKTSTAPVQETKAKTSALSNELSDNFAQSKTSPAKDSAKKNEVPAPIKPTNKNSAVLQGPPSFARIVEQKAPIENLKKSESSDGKSTNKTRPLNDKRSGDEKSSKVESNTDGGDSKPENLELQNKHNKPNPTSNDNDNKIINLDFSSSTIDVNDALKNDDDEKVERRNADKSKQKSKEEKTNQNQKKLNAESFDSEKITDNTLKFVDSDAEKGKLSEQLRKTESVLEKDTSEDFKGKKDEKDGDNKLKKKNNSENENVSHISAQARSDSSGSIQSKQSSSRQESDVPQNTGNVLASEHVDNTSTRQESSNIVSESGSENIAPTSVSSRQESGAPQSSNNVNESAHGNISDSEKPISSSSKQVQDIPRSSENVSENEQPSASENKPTSSFSTQENDSININDNNQNNDRNIDNNINNNNNSNNNNVNINLNNNANNNENNDYIYNYINHDIIIDDNNNNIGNINNNIDDNNNNIENNNYNIDDNNNNINVINNNNINNNDNINLDANNESNPDENNPDNYNNENVNSNPEGRNINQGSNNNENADINSDGATKSENDRTAENNENIGDENVKNNEDGNKNLDLNSLVSSSTSNQEQEKDSSNADTATSNASSSSQPARNVLQRPVLNYEEGQWSPDNADGKKCYNRDQLITLRDAAASQNIPQIDDSFQLVKQSNNFMPNFGNTKNQSASLASRNQFNKRCPTQPGMQQGQQGGGSGSGKGSRSGMIHVSLSLREDVKLNESANAWKPAFLTGVAQVNDGNNIDALCKRVRGILNKLTPEKFEPLLEQIQALNIDTNEKLSSVISLVFEKAIDEPNFSVAYAMLCRKLSKPIEEKEEKERKEREENAGSEKKPVDKKESSTQAIFKKELLNKCQQEFNNHVANENSIQTKLTPIQNEINETPDQTRKLELRSLLEEEERKLRRRSVGTVRFIGELYRQNMLITNIMEWCIIALLKIRTEEKLECLCKLLTTVGKKMEEKTGDEVQNQKHYRDLTPHFHTMSQIATDNKKHPKISSRVRFMLMDVIELRKNKWVPRRNDVNPKTMVQIQKEAEEEQYNNELLNMMVGSNSGNLSGGMGGNNQRGKDGRDRNDRGMRNDHRGGSLSGSGFNLGGNNNSGNKNIRGGYQDQEGWIQQGSNKNRGSTSSNTIVDTSKFQSRTNIDANTSLGAANQFKWNQHLSKGAATTSLTNSFSVLEPDTYKSIPSSNNRSRELYQSKGSIERTRYDNPGSRSGSQHGSRENSMARNTYSSSSRSLHQPLHFNTLPMSSASQKGLRVDNKSTETPIHQSLSSSSIASLPSNLASSSASQSNQPSSQQTTVDKKQSEEVTPSVLILIKSIAKTVLTSHQNGEFREYSDLEHAPQLDKIPECDRWAVIQELHNLAVDTTGLNDSDRLFIGTICTYWMKRDRLDKSDYIRGLSDCLNLIEDLIIDVPKVCEWTSQMISAVLKESVINLNELKEAGSDLFKSSVGSKLIRDLLKHLAYEYGPQFVRDLWKNSKCSWSQFVQDDIKSFIQENKLEFVEDPKANLPPTTVLIAANKLKTRLREFIKNAVSDDVINEYIKVNVPTINKQSIRLLTKTFIEISLQESNGIKLNEDTFRNCLSIFKSYINVDVKTGSQVECLYAVQLLVNDLEHPSGLLRAIFVLFYDEEIISYNAFQTWTLSSEEQNGKGVAMKNLTSFLQTLKENEIEYED